MVGYSDPKMGNQRRSALAQYLRGQSQSRANAAGRMKGLNMSAIGSRAAGAGTPFQRGGGKASPEKFAFAGVKPSLKTLLGLVGKTMGVGGVAPSFNIFGPDTPVGGLEWGGEISPTTPTQEPGSIPSPMWNYTGGRTDRRPYPPQSTTIGPDGIPVDPYSMPIYSSSGWGQMGFGKPILGDLLYGGF